MSIAGRLLRWTARLALAAVVLIAAASVWLYATKPQPRHAADWGLGAPLPWPRGELATAVAHTEPCAQPPCPELERLYVIGGLSGLGTTEDAVTIFDPVERQWNTGPSLPAPRHHLAAAGLGEAIYVSGGSAEAMPPWSAEASFWKLEAGSDAWEPLADMPEPRLGHRMVVHDGTLYVIGGQGGSSGVLIYTPQQGWRSGAVMPRPRHHLSAVAANGRIWAIGGRSGGSLGRVDVYDIEADAWLPWPNLPTPASGAAEGIVDGAILIVAGEEPSLVFGEVYDRHWMMDIGAETPDWLQAPPPPLPVHGADGAVFQGTLVIAGGASRHGALSVTAWSAAVQWLDATALRPRTVAHDGGR